MAIAQKAKGALCRGPVPFLTKVRESMSKAMPFAKKYRRAMPADLHQGRLRFLVIGCGSIGKRHLKNLLTLKAGEVLAFDVQEDRRAEVRSQYEVKW